MKEGKIATSARKIAFAFSGWGLSLKGFRNNNRGEWFLIIQIIIIVLHILPSIPVLGFSPQWIKVSGIAIFCIGIISSIKAFLSLGVNLSPLAYPKDKGSLITSGSYRNCRHPIYRSLLLLSLGVTIYKASLIHLTLLFALTLVLKEKASKEEEYLSQIYSGYDSYKRNTHAIIKSIPFLDW